MREQIEDNISIVLTIHNVEKVRNWIDDNTCLESKVSAVDFLHVDRSVRQFALEIYDGKVRYYNHKVETAGTRKFHVFSAVIKEELKRRYPKVPKSAANLEIYTDKKSL